MKDTEKPVNDFVVLIMGASLALAMISLVFISSPEAPTAKQKAAAPCSTNSYPCIKITQADGTVYKLNDFKLIANHCIRFVSLPDGVHRKACNAKLDWIGPAGGREV